MNDDIIELSAKVLARSYVAGVQIRKTSTSTSSGRERRGDIGVDVDGPFWIPSRRVISYDLPGAVFQFIFFNLQVS